MVVHRHGDRSVSSFMARCAGALGQFSRPRPSAAMPFVMLASGRLRTLVLGPAAGVCLPGGHVLKRVLRRPAAVAYRHHRLAAVAVSGLTDLRSVTVRGDGAHVIAVRPVAW